VDKLTNQQLLKKKKKLPTGQPPGKTKTELLKYQHQDWILEE
jgi:hypothetical protein